MTPLLPMTLFTHFFTLFTFIPYIYILVTSLPIFKYIYTFIKTNKYKCNTHANADARAYNQKTQPVLLKEERYKFELQVY